MTQPEPSIEEQIAAVEREAEEWRGLSSGLASSRSATGTGPTGKYEAGQAVIFDAAAATLRSYAALEAKRGLTPGVSAEYDDAMGMQQDALIERATAAEAGLAEARAQNENLRKVLRIIADAGLGVNIAHGDLAAATLTALYRSDLAPPAAKGEGR